MDAAFMDCHRDTVRLDHDVSMAIARHHDTFAA